MIDLGCDDGLGLLACRVTLVGSLALSLIVREDYTPGSRLPLGHDCFTADSEEVVDSLED